MTNRNIAIYRLVENNDTTRDATVAKQLISEPYTISVDFMSCVIDIIVSVDNDFDNGSFTVETQSDNVSIKRSGNLVRIIVSPNYTDYYLDNIINFEHNVTGELIPLLIRQTFQTYNLVLEVPTCTDTSTQYCCNYAFSYVAKDNRPIEKRDYKIRDNVFLTGNEKEIISETEYNNLTPSVTEVSPLQYVNIENSSDVIYAEEYSTMNEEEKSAYATYRYIFSNDEYNDIKICDANEESCNYTSDYVLYWCESENGDTISASEWLKISPEPEEGESQQYYSIRRYIKTFDSSTQMVDKPRYYYNPSVYRLTITNQQYQALNDDCKDACIPVVYEHIYNDDIEISAEEYDKLTLNDQYYYKPKWYMVRDNVNKDDCKNVVSAETYEGYVLEGKYDYIKKQGSSRYYRDITSDEYAEYPENGTSDYYIYQYICIRNYQDYKVNDIIDFVEYQSLGLTDDNEYFSIYRYGSGDFVKTILEWRYIDIITVDEFELLPLEEQAKYDEITIEGETFMYFAEVATYDEYNSLDEDEKEKYQQVLTQETIDINTYRDKEDRYEYVPEEIITPSKYNSLPVYGKKEYVPNNFVYVDDEGIEIEIDSQAYFDIDLTRGDYVLNSVELGDDEIDLEEYELLDDYEQGNYELCVRINYIVNQHNSEYVPKCVIPINVKCVGGSYDFMVNGMTKYKRADTQDYELDYNNNIISNYTLVNNEEYIAEEPLFSYKKVKSNIIEEGFVTNKLELTSYGWLDSTFIDDSLDKDIFYRIKLSHKDVIGLDKTIRVVLGVEHTLHELKMPQYINIPMIPSEHDEPTDYEGSDSGSEFVEEFVEIIPSIEIEDMEDNILEFGPQGGIRAVNVVTVPEDSAIVFQYTSNIVSSYRIDQHTISITVPKNKYGTEQSCICKVINSEYPSCSVSFVLKQLGYR